MPACDGDDNAGALLRGSGTLQRTTALHGVWRSYCCTEGAHSYVKCDYGNPEIFLDGYAGARLVPSPF